MKRRIHEFRALYRARRRTEKTLTPYRCDLCGQWHVGQNSGLKKPVKTIRNNHQLRFT